MPTVGVNIRISDKEWRDDYRIKNGIIYHKRNNYNDILKIIQSLYLVQPHDGIYERWLVDGDGRIFVTNSVWGQHVADYRTKILSEKRGEMPKLFTEVILCYEDKNSASKLTLDFSNNGYTYLNDRFIKIIQKAISDGRKVIRALEPNDIKLFVCDDNTSSKIILNDDVHIVLSELDKWMLNYYKGLQHRCRSIKKEWKL